MHGNLLRHVLVRPGTSNVVFQALHGHLLPMPKALVHVSEEPFACWMCRLECTVLCIVLCDLHIVQYALCVVRCALCVVRCALRVVCYAVCMHSCEFVVCFVCVLCVFCVCFVFALHDVYVLCVILRFVWFCALCALCDSGTMCLHVCFGGSEGVIGVTKYG